VRILIADDEDGTRLKLETLLEKLGYEVVVARDGTEAWELLQRDDAPALALLDWLMPGLDGVEVCRRVRRSGRLTYVYIVMLTVKGQKQDLVAGMEAGADDYLSKPFDVEELRVRLHAGERILALQEELRAQATHDDLTGVLNRGTVLEILQRELALVARKSVPVAIILADLDDFKQVNDKHGHAIGDTVLREAARRLATPMRPYDAIGRYGGEEFLIVLPGCGLNSALLVAERVRGSVGGRPITTPAGNVAMTVSLGVSAVEKAPPRLADELIQAADEALYRAKRAGRNRVEHASSPDDRP
jgi:two-component system, cell cycle response regulator